MEREVEEDEESCLRSLSAVNVYMKCTFLILRHQNP
jgi:hypothetical protein